MALLALLCFCPALLACLTSTVLLRFLRSRVGPTSEQDSPVVCRGEKGVQGRCRSGVSVDYCGSTKFGVSVDYCGSTKQNEKNAIRQVSSSSSENAGFHLESSPPTPAPREIFYCYDTFLRTRSRERGQSRSTTRTSSLEFGRDHGLFMIEYGSSD